MKTTTTKHHTVRLTKSRDVYIDNEYAGDYEITLSGWLSAHFMSPSDYAYQTLKADTRRGLWKIISDTINNK